MNIAVVSPHTLNNGTTTLAALLGMELATRGKLVCLAHSSQISESFYSYFNLKAYEDKTNNPTQLVKLIREGAVQPEEVRDYCKSITEQLDLFSNRSKSFTQEDMDYMIEYICGFFPHEFCIFDIDDDFESRASKHIISGCDLIILNITQSARELQKFADNREGILKVFGDKPIMVVVNRFAAVAGTIKDAARMMGIKKPNNWFTLRYNPWIAWGTNTGNVVQVYNKAKSKDIRVVEIDSDLTKVGTAILKMKVASKQQNSAAAKTKAINAAKKSPAKAPVTTPASVSNTKHGAAPKKVGDKQ